MTSELAETEYTVTCDGGVAPNTASFVHLRGHLFDQEASMDVRAACLRDIDRGVTDVFVDLTGVTTICDDATDVLDAAADELRAKHGALWIASFDRSPDWHAVPAEGLSVMRGLSEALDAALATRPDIPKGRDGIETREGQ